MPTKSSREAVARAICAASDERPDAPGGCRDNEGCWQDYLGGRPSTAQRCADHQVKEKKGS